MLQEQTTQTKIEVAGLPAGYSARSATMADAQIVTDLLNAETMHSLGIEKFSYDECVQEWSEPGFNVEESSLMVFASDGRLAGYIEIWDNEPIPAKPLFFGATHPDFYGLGVGTAMLEWAEKTAVRTFARVPEHMKIVAIVATFGSHRPSCELGESFGTLTRAFWRMIIDLDQEIPEPLFPDGLELVNYAEHEDALAFYRAYEESFEDHWGHVKQPEAEGFAQFKHAFNDPDFDPTLWFAVKDGDEIAAVCLCEPKSNEDRTIGNVDTLGVRRNWRRKGLGLALLHHAFREFQARGGFRRVALGVDAGSLTGATRLYERAGMRVERSTNVYEKVLREGVDPTTRELNEGE